MSPPEAAPSDEFGRAYAAEQVRRGQHPLRRVVKGFYLRNLLRDVSGPTIDFGCGAGQLLARLPAGSLGLEINPFLIEALQRKGLDVMAYDGHTDDFSLSTLPTGRFQSFVMSHVLEHFDAADQLLRKLMRAARRLGVRRFVMVVPGRKGFRSDATHKTFIDRRYLEDHGLIDAEGYALGSSRHFPLDVARIGDVFVFHEFIAVYALRD